MILKNGSFSQMASLLRESEKKIIIFGAGMIGTVTTPAILEEYGLENRILFYVDNDLSKCGEKVPVRQEKKLRCLSCRSIEAVRWERYSCAYRSKPVFRYSFAAGRD